MRAIAPTYKCNHSKGDDVDEQFLLHFLVRATSHNGLGS